MPPGDDHKDASRGDVGGPTDRFTLESAYGSVQPSAHPEDLDQLVRDAKDAKAERTVRELREA